MIERALPALHSVQSVGSAEVPEVPPEHLLQPTVGTSTDPLQLHGAMMRAGASKRIARTMAFI